MLLRILATVWLCLVLNASKGQEVVSDSLIRFFKTKMDSIIVDGIDSMAFPGCQVLVATKDRIIFQEAYGYHTYDSIKTVNVNDLYDLASITKVSSGLPILMKLYGEGKINLDLSIEHYLPFLRRSNKADLTLRQILTHQSGMIPYIVYWENTIKKNGKYKRRTFKANRKKQFPIRITDSLYLHKNYRKKIKKAVKDSELLENKEYRYSGLFFLFLPELVEMVTGENFLDYLQREVYDPVGALELLFKPHLTYSRERIVPTEQDTLFRNQLVHGSVHDEAAAMLNGVSCNAGLFSNARSLAKLFQLYLNDGRIGDKEIITPQAVKEFTKCQYCESGNRRGLGFDKPLIQYDAQSSYIAESASPSSFGHSGFTGTFVWADPEADLLFVFLSNRVHPSRDQRKLYSMDLRPKMHQLVYDFFAIKNK